MMTTKLIKTIGISSVICIGAIYILFAIAEKQNDKPNGFHRRILNRKAEITSVVDLKISGCYFAGYSKNRIYVSSIKDPFFLCNISALADTQTIRLPLPDEVYAWRYSRLSVDSPYVYISDGISPKFYQSTFPKLAFQPILPRNTYFNKALNISPQSFITRGISRGTKENVLIKISADSPFVDIKSKILIKQIDGLFCTDGQMRYDKESHKIVYLYHYRNQFLCLDTNINILLRGQTIDTNSVAKIEVSYVSGKEKFIFSAPPTVVNGAFSIYKNDIYVISALISDEEKKKDHEDNGIVDVYSLSSGNYKYSFYLPRYKNEMISDITIINNCIFTMSGERVVLYNLPKLDEAT